MVAAVHYLATSDDHDTLLDYLDEPSMTRLHPWPVAQSPLEVLTRAEAMARTQVMISRIDVGAGAPVVIRSESAPAMTGPTKASLFNRLNWERLRPGPQDGLVDSNRSPVLFWRPASGDSTVLVPGEIGSQADSMAAISPDYDRWARRVMDWLRRRGTKVWGLEREQTRPDLDLRFGFVSNVYALPNALDLLTQGAVGTDRPELL